MTLPTRTLIASHRGGALQWPENSPTAFRNTAALAVDQVEFDIHPTADGEIVVIHDATLDRTTSGSGPVAARTLAELRALVLAGTQDDRIMTLAEFCTVFAPTPITLRMEVKPDHDHRPYPGLLARGAGRAGCRRAARTHDRHQLPGRHRRRGGRDTGAGPCDMAGGTCGAG
jgi:glycerophosphoryl diester phosphodiesterase